MTTTPTAKPTGKQRPTARERLLESANELFYREGVQSVGIDRIIEHAGVAKASLYNTFGSKEELVHAYLEHRHEVIAAQDPGRGRRPGDAARQDPRGLRQPGHDDARARLPGLRLRRRERGGQAGRVRRAVHPLLPGVAARAVHRAVHGAGARDPEALARQLHLLYDGAAASGNLDHDPAGGRDRAGGGREPDRRRRARPIGATQAGR